MWMIIIKEEKKIGLYIQIKIDLNDFNSITFWGMPL